MTLSDEVLCHVKVTLHISLTQCCLEDNLAILGTEGYAWGLELTTIEGPLHLQQL
jgi:hypothetical protein